MKINIYIVFILWFVSTGYSQMRYLSIKDINNQRQIIPLDSIRNVTFLTNQTYALRVNRTDGSQTDVLISNIKKTTILTAIDLTIPHGQDEVTPDVFILRQNYPNPFNPATTIAYELPAPGPVTVQIFDLRGRLIRTLISAVQTAGRHQVIWTGDNDRLQYVSSGVYLYRVHYNDAVQIKKCIFIK